MLAKNEVNDALAKAPMFGMLDAAGRDAVAQELRETVFEPGQVIFSRGDPGNFKNNPKKPSKHSPQL